MTALPRPTIRKATAADGPALLELIDALADYEKLARPDAAARARLLADGFGPTPRFDSLIAFQEIAPGEHKAIGYAIYFETYSSFLALPSLYLEDVFVLEDHRGTGAGKALFRAVVQAAADRACGRVEFQVLDWNRLARDFYERIGAKHLHDWCPYRIVNEDFEKVLKATAPKP